MTGIPDTTAEPAELIRHAAKLLRHALEQCRTPDAYARLARFSAAQVSVDWGTLWSGQHDQPVPRKDPPEDPLPVLLRDVEQLARIIIALQTMLAGFAETAYRSETERAEIFGMPVGKSAFRNVSEYLRDTLKISLKQAKLRLKLAHQLSPPATFDGSHTPTAPHPDVAAQFFLGQLDTLAAEIIIDTVNQTEREAVRANVLSPVVEDRLKAGQAHLAEQAMMLDPDGLRQLARRWAQYTRHWLDQDGRPPTESLDRTRGAFYRGEVQGLHNWVLRVDDLFHERLRVLSAVINNPAVSFDPLKELLEKVFGAALPKFAAPAAQEENTAELQEPLFSEDELGAPIDTGDIRTREQRLLDGVTAILDTGLSFASTTFPVSGGMPPQLSVIMDYQTLYEGLTHDCAATGQSRPGATNFIAQALFTGPISPSTIRPLSCEAHLIPAVLGSNGAVLELGRTARLFSLDQRKALIARDRGCTAPGCKIPAPWCDAHHVKPWNAGGSTDISNAVLLCSHHHHAVHAGIWAITMRHGVAWFTPAPYLDPDRRPRRNRYWR